MHKSRLSTFVIDCKVPDVEVAAQFWGEALGRRVRRPGAGDGDRYRDLECAPSEPVLMIQKVEHESRMHLDIESDDIPAEVARLESLGAKKIEAIRTWVVMQAPTGQRFCVVKPQRGEMVLNATTWPSSAALTFEPSSAEHPKLQALAGRYLGLTKTWLDPTQPPEESTAELRIESIFGGRWLRLEQHGTCMNQPHAGEMLLGFHRDADQFELAWVDSFHTGSAIMFSTGPRREDGLIAVTGCYLAMQERWGWRTEFDNRNGLTTRAFNIMPSGDESPAIDTTWTRL